MKKMSILLITVMCLISGEFCLAEHSESDIWNGDTLTDGFWETVARLQSSPLTVQLSFVAKSLENPNLTSVSVTTAVGSCD